MLYKVSHQADAKEVDVVGDDFLFRNCIHRLIDTIPLDALRMVFKLRKKDPERTEFYPMDFNYKYSAFFDDGLGYIKYDPSLIESLPPDPELVKKELIMFSGLLKGIPMGIYQNEYHFGLEEVMIAVCVVHNLSPDRVREKTRKREILAARHEFFYIAKEYTSWSLKKIGEFAGDFDHSTVLHGCNVIKNFLSLPNEERVRKDIDQIKSILDLV